jgi:glutamate synthase (ferredoxin)
MVAGKPGQSGEELERQLFIVRKLIERRKAAQMGAAAEDFYVCTLSSRTIVYKVRGWGCVAGAVGFVLG